LRPTKSFLFIPHVPLSKKAVETQSEDQKTDDVGDEAVLYAHERLAAELETGTTHAVPELDARNTQISELPAGK
jgi:hypothetical protein